MPSKAARKNDETDAASAVVLIPGSVTATAARDIFGKLLNRAGFGGERIPITDRGEVKAYLIGPADFELLDQLPPRGGKNGSNVREHDGAHARVGSR